MLSISDYETCIYPAIASPARAMHLSEESFSYNKRNLPPIKTYNQCNPIDVATLGLVEKFRGNNIQNICIKPIQYDPLQGFVIYKKFSYIIHNIEIPKTENIPNILNNTCLNKSQHNKMKSNRFDTIIGSYTDHSVDFLILAPEELATGARDLYYVKRWMGYNVMFETRKSWTCESIKNCIREFYENARNPYYVLLLGDTSLMPSEKLPIFENSTSKYLYTDLYYMCMDGPDDHLPDLFYGRIPASSNEEMLAVSNKIFKYQKDPNNGSEISRFLGAAQFEDNNNGKDINNFVRTVETVYQSLNYVFDDNQTIYYSNSKVTPCSWSDGTVGFEFPDRLKRSDIWSGNYLDIVRMINKGCNLILHRGHGSEIGWRQPSFETGDISHLKNDVYPILFSINCKTGDFSAKNNFATKLLCQKDAGAVTVIGATADSHTEANNIFTLAMMKCIWPVLDFKYYTPSLNLSDEYFAPVETVGEVMLAGLLKMEETFDNSQYPNYNNDIRLRQRREYHCIGDPSLQFYWGMHYPIKDYLEVNFENGILEISITNLEGANISVCDHTNNIVKRGYGSYVKFNECFSPETSVVISKHGMNPIVFFASSYPNLITAIQEPNPSTSIASYTINEANELNIEIKNDSESEITLIISEGTTSAILNQEVVITNSTSNNIKLKRSDSYIYITLLEGGKVIDSKKIFRK